jgi:hypothetical protein
MFRLHREDHGALEIRLPRRHLEEPRRCLYQVQEEPHWSRCFEAHQQLRGPTSVKLRLLRMVHRKRQRSSDFQVTPYQSSFGTRGVRRHNAGIHLPPDRDQAPYVKPIKFDERQTCGRSGAMICSAAPLPENASSVHHARCFMQICIIG